mgnify:CR=1 FL=1
MKASTVEQRSRPVVVTDRQVLALAEDTNRRADSREITPIQLTGDHAIGTEVDIEGPPDFDVGEPTTAGALAPMWLALLFADLGGVEQGLELLVNLCGLLLLGLGAFVGYRAYDTPDGEIEVTIQTRDDEDGRELELPDDAGSVVRAVTTVVGASHPYPTESQ